MDAGGRRALGRRLREAREAMGWDRARLAGRLGVHAGSVARWETGGSAPLPYHLERIAEWAGVDPHWLRHGTAPAEAGEAPGAVEPEAEDLFASLDAVARFLGGIGPAGEERLRKLDALEGLRRMLTARGLLPGWWYQLRDRVENDEL
jgi:transcriptional regulator with XRE-family HTH domain